MTAIPQQLSDLPALTPHQLRQLEKEGITTCAQVLRWYPFRHEDRRSQATVGFQSGPVPCGHHVVVTKASTRYFGRGRGRGAFEAQVAPVVPVPLGDTLTLRWWNMPFMNKVIAEGQEMFIYGVIKDFKGRLSMDHPEYELLAEEGDAPGDRIHTGRITPIYRLKGGVAQKTLRTAAWHVLQHLDPAGVDSYLPPPSPDGEFAGWSSARALRAIHFPESMDELEQARRFLALEEFFLYQLRVVHRRLRVRDSGGIRHAGEARLAGELAGSLPFALTPAQQRCLDEIRRDMAAAAPMNRLLHGDVGSGKTIVAFFSILQAIESGSQAALMAPTQILAEQHLNNARKWLEPLGLQIGLLTGSRKEDGSGNELWSPREASGRGPDLVIGTHALLNDQALLSRLGLVVIDEQHKFGVSQRAQLIRKGRTPDVLVMTATPIPRTLTLTLYGDLDVSTIDERPKERGKVITKVRPLGKQKEALAFLTEQLEQNRQAYLVYPLIEESEKLDAAAATKAFEEWQKHLPHFEVGLIHGRLPAEEKDQIMRRFRDGKIDALVSTTVIEVGVDVPNATVMYLHNAERFGLAQLHQLRGRIGRGSATSYCVLFIKDKDDDARQRLAIMEETSDGFRIAEEDLR
ncbi:MAG: ATP-dependent DNA helicase RecG, partial [Verrucomicrobiales bacterium]|nr:ATP-dependent DNA helicase RecG [Verrucomicrobiales bacterium]